MGLEAQQTEYFGSDIYNPTARSRFVASCISAKGHSALPIYVVYLAFGFTTYASTRMLRTKTTLALRSTRFGYFISECPRILNGIDNIY